MAGSYRRDAMVSAQLLAEISAYFELADRPAEITVDAIERAYFNGPPEQIVAMKRRQAQAGAP